MPSSSDQFPSLFSCPEPATNQTSTALRAGRYHSSLMVRQSPSIRSLSLDKRFEWLIPLVLSVGFSSCTVAPKPTSIEGKIISSVVIRHSLPERASHAWDRKLCSYIKIKEGIPYSNELADDSIRSLFESGYVDDARLLAEEDVRSVRMIIEVEDHPAMGPGPSIVGNTAFSDLKLFRLVRPIFKGPILEIQVEAAREKIQQFYRRENYKQAKVTINYERWGKRNIQEFVLIVEEGPRTPSWYEGIFRSPEKAAAP